jgi:FkbM family methyltransferase
MMQTLTLSDGKEIFCLNKNEATWVYQEVQGYLKHGIKLKPDDTVFDVGANIGMFTLYLNGLFNQSINVYAFEPIPVIFDTLAQNVQRHNPDRLKAFCCGLAQESKWVEFDFYPDATTISSVSHSAHGTDPHSMQHLAKEVLLRHPEHAPFPGNLLRWVPSFVRSHLIDRAFRTQTAVQRVNCQLRTLSEVVRENNIAQIDLLKIDVEKSEMEVLLGIEPADWQKIQQIVLEVHDVDHRLDQVTTLLKRHGLKIAAIEQEPLFKGSEVFNLYAMR